MLKTRQGEVVWLVQQPDHARVSGYLAAHWGGGDFVRPGYYAPSADAERLRQAVVQAVAEHDNGWWEWEADPTIDEADHLPLGLAEVGRRRTGDGFQRWRLGVPRLAESHPYAALLISLHAYWLYAFAWEDKSKLDDAWRHPLFGGQDRAKNIAPDAELTRVFLREQQETQRALVERLHRDPFWVEAIKPAHLQPHARLLQTMDALSLLLAFGGEQPHDLPDIPRRGWDDRVTLAWRPAGEGRIVCDPYPFDADPLEVFLPVRMLPAETKPSDAGDEAHPLTRLHAAPLRTIRFELASVAAAR